MHSISVKILLAFVAQAPTKELLANRRSRAQDSVNNSTDKLVDQPFDTAYDSTDSRIDELVGKLFDRALVALPLRDADLASTANGKPGHLAIPSNANPKPLLRLDADAHSSSIGSPLPFPGYRLQFHGQARKGRQIHASAYHEVAQLAATAIHQHHVGQAATGILQHHVGQLQGLPLRAGDIKAALSMLQDLPKQWLAWYDHEALTFPLMTKSTTTGVCYSFGDLCAQGIDSKNLSTLDFSRSLRSGLAGFPYGAMVHYELDFLDKSLSFGGAWWAVVPKLAIEEGPFTIVSNTLYSMLVGALKFQEPKEVARDIRAAFVPGLQSSIRFWPVVDLINFSVIPIQLQVLWGGVFEIVWACILSEINNEGIGRNGAHGDEKKVVIIVPDRD